MQTTLTYLSSYNAISQGWATSFACSRAKFREQPKRRVTLLYTY